MSSSRSRWVTLLGISFIPSGIFLILIGLALGPLSFITSALGIATMLTGISVVHRNRNARVWVSTVLELVVVESGVLALGGLGFTCWWGLMWLVVNNKINRHEFERNTVNQTEDRQRITED